MTRHPSPTLTPMNRMRASQYLGPNLLVEHLISFLVYILNHFSARPYIITVVYSIFVFALLSSPAAAQTASTNSTILPVGTCTKSIPCANGACCNGETGLCGFGPSFCTLVSKGGNCTSNCDALAECGVGSAPGNETCPLNVCCSRYGFCGTTTDFCEPGCQSNCSPAKISSCGVDAQTALQRRIGYYEGWAVQASSRACDVFLPGQISALTLTHVNFAFALISEDFKIKEMTPGDSDLWARTTALKEENIGLQVFLSIGGWSFNDPPTQNIFSNLVASTENTNAFIQSALSVMQAYGFDGLDIDWEYPVASERGGSPADKENYPKFMARVKAAFSSKEYGLTFTAPSSYWYLQHFDLPELLKSADWVNVMTYDLHGVWDGTDPYIGKVINAHTNLTEIKETFQLFANVGINPSQIVMGMAFYGRSFQLADEACSEPGCPFVGPANAGPCSMNPGTLMYAEIETIINSDNVNPVFDSVDAVNYVTFSENQWVSYDDAQTFQMKLDYANSICLGGTMVWSVDQDDTAYTALSGLYGTVNELDNHPTKEETNNLCRFTACGDKCPPGYDSLTTVSMLQNDVKACPKHKPSRLCCPAGSKPQKCSWRGGGGSSCEGQCNVGEILMALDVVGGDGKPTCTQGYKAYCCESGEADPGACFGGDCGSNQCPSGYSVETYVKQGSTDDGTCEQKRTKHGICPEICSSNSKPLCCLENAGYSNCEWVGDPPNCLNAICKAGQTAIFSDMQGDSPVACKGKGKRYYCCDPPSNTLYLPVNSSWIFPEISPVDSDAYSPDEPATFAVDFDDNEGTKDDTQTGAGTSNLSDDGKENDSPFGEIFISSPNAAAVSSLDIYSDWVITNCSATSDGPQEVLAYCSRSIDDEESGCGHVFIGQAENTIVRMPKSCGLGPYARVVSLVVHYNQHALSPDDQARKPSTEPVYLLRFDYDFLSIPESNGPVLMRADITDIPGYWDEFIDAPPDSGTTSTKKRDFHHSPEYEKRWFGPFDSWLNKLNSFRSKHSTSRNFHWHDQYTLYSGQYQCPVFESKLDISVSGSAQITSQFGYYLEATIVPPEVQQAYVYFQAGAQAQASFTISGIAASSYDSNRHEIVSFGFPGLYYPGLITLGPTLHLYGELSGHLSLSGSLQQIVTYKFPSIYYAVGKQNSGSAETDFSDDVNPSSKPVNGYDYSFAYNVELEGSLDAHLIPSLQLGINVLSGTLLDAQVFVEADVYAGIGINGSVSSSAAASVCVNPHYGAVLTAGITGSILGWSAQPQENVFYSNENSYADKCFTSEPEASSTSGSRRGEYGYLPTIAASDTNSETPLSLDSAYADDATGAHSGASLNKFKTPAHSILGKPNSRLSKKEHENLQLPVSSWTINDENIDNNISEIGPSRTKLPHKLGSTRKRDNGTPYFPCTLICPPTGSDISNKTQIDGDIYSDSGSADDATGQLADILNRRTAKYEDDPQVTRNMNWSLLLHRQLGADFPELDGNFSSQLSEDASASMKVCPRFRIQIPSFSSTNIITYFDLADPGQIDPTYGRYNPVPLNLGTTRGSAAFTTPNNRVIYGREHVYEQSMSTIFVDYLVLGTDLWLNSAQDNTYCSWVKENLVNKPSYFSQTSLFNRVGACYPGGANGTDRMVVLEQNANTPKNRALYFMEQQLVPVLGSPQSLLSTTSFSQYSATKKVARLRAAAGVASYMNDYSVQSAFVRDNECIRKAWQDWYNAYLDAPDEDVDAPNRSNINVPNVYDNFIHLLVSNMVPFIRSEITDLISYYQDNYIDLSFALLIDNRNTLNRGGQPVDTGGAPYTQNTYVTQDELINQLLNAIPDISWVNQLPTH